ncbi:MerR family transcriptional regulator [Saccharothrix xinjiangensis]|uniref:MerR family transcriptional regulator n=1 Tax=Saccharothrix xinjiangensis TaxID=204798 RepID=A0ABV9YCH4_9PSEU
MLSIGEFSEMCHLSPQALRFYHAKELLVPAEVDERTGYRGYAFDQVEQAVLIAALRGAGMSVDLVRRALDEPDAALDLLRRHEEEVRRRRRAQDEAISDAHRLFGARPEVRRRHVPATTVASKQVPGPAATWDRYDWAEVEAATAETVRHVVEAVEPCGAVVAGAPWLTWAIETPEQKRRGLTSEGPHWLVKVPVEVGGAEFAALPDDVEVQPFAAREELSILMPGRNSMAKFGTALSRLVSHPLEDAYVDLSCLRHVLHDDGVETAVAIRELDDEDDLPTT